MEMNIRTMKDFTSRLLRGSALRKYHISRPSNNTFIIHVLVGRVYISCKIQFIYFSYYSTINIQMDALIVWTKKKVLDPLKEPFLPFLAPLVCTERNDMPIVT